MNKYFLAILVIVIIITGVLGYYLFLKEAPIIDPIEEEQTEEETVTVSLYYYNPEKDKDEQGNIKCSADGLVAVERDIVNENVIERTIESLIEGDITEQERQEKGIETEFPLNDFKLVASELENGVLTLFFADPQLQTIGGSCRTGILWHQISKTAKQFERVEEVKFEPQDMLFQP